MGESCAPAALRRRVSMARRALAGARVCCAPAAPRRHVQTPPYALEALFVRMLLSMRRAPLIST
eukprot:11371921-Alexandrium_andersonii.AAC.1